MGTGIHEGGRVMNQGNRPWRPASRCRSTALRSSKCFYTAFGLVGNRQEIWNRQPSHWYYEGGARVPAPKRTSIKTGGAASPPPALFLAHFKVPEFSRILYFVSWGMLADMVTHTISSFSHHPLGPPGGCSTHRYTLCICRHACMCTHGDHFSGMTFTRYFETWSLAGLEFAK